MGKLFFLRFLMILLSPLINPILVSILPSFILMTWLLPEMNASIRALQHFLSQHFEMKSSILNYFHGLEVTSSSCGYCLSQTKYVFGLLFKTSLTNNKIISTPLDSMPSLFLWMVNLYRMLLITFGWFIHWSISQSPT